MQQAIFTSWLSPTNTQGSRIKAFGKDKRQCVIDGWDHGAHVDENHCRVAKLLAAKLDWSGLYVGGNAGPDGYVFVHVVRDHASSTYAKTLAGNMRGDALRSFGIEGRDWFYLPERSAK